MKEQLENLIEVYNNHIRNITYSTSYKYPSKVQTVSVLREVVTDLKLILNNDWTTDSKSHYQIS